MAVLSGLRPNVFVVGDAKCGTTSLHRLFELASGVGTARTRKELHFFSAPELVARTAGPGDAAIPAAIVQDEAAYLDEYAHLDPRLPVVVDVSPSYLQNAAAAARIATFAPEARIVILLREPAAKVFSQYVHLWSAGRETLPFEEAFGLSDMRRKAGWSDMFDYAAGGFYAEAVRRYLDCFGPERVLVLRFEDVVADWPETRAKLEAFMGTALPKTNLPRMNAGGRVRSPLLAKVIGNDQLKFVLRTVLPLSLRTWLGGRLRSTIANERPRLAPEMATMLRQRFAPDVALLESRLGRQMGWPASD
jgi:hypothetical protein